MKKLITTIVVIITTIPNPSSANEYLQQLQDLQPVQRKAPNPVLNEEIDPENAIQLINTMHTLRQSVLDMGFDLDKVLDQPEYYSSVVLSVCSTASNLTQEFLHLHNYNDADNMTYRDAFRKYNKMEKHYKKVTGKVNQCHSAIRIGS